MILNSLTSAYSQVRDSTLSSTIQQRLPSTNAPTTDNPPTPTCECPNCNTITEISINYINPGETKQTYCQNCEGRFGVEFTEDQSWNFHSHE